MFFLEDFLLLVIFLIFFYMGIIKFVLRREKSDMKEKVLVKLRQLDRQFFRVGLIMLLSENIMLCYLRVLFILLGGVRLMVVERFEGKNIFIEKLWSVFENVKSIMLDVQVEMMQRRLFMRESMFLVIIILRWQFLFLMRLLIGFEMREIKDVILVIKLIRKGFVLSVIVKGEIMGLVKLMLRKKKNVERLRSQMFLSVFFIKYQFLVCLFCFL